MNNFKNISLLGLGVALLGSYMLTAAPVQAQAEDFAAVATHNTKFKEVDVTEYSAALLSEDGKKLFGTGKGGMNGVSASDLTEATLIDIPLSANETIIDIDAGISNVLVATSEGDVYTYGLAFAPYLSSGSATPVDITSFVNSTKQAISYVRQGTDVAFIIFQDGTIVGWGSNAFGQLGVTAISPTVRSIQTIPTTFKSTNTIVDFDVRFRSGYALLSNGRVYTWGYNANGQLGLANTTNTATPTLVSGLSSVIVYSVSIGFDHAIALSGSGKNFSIFGFGSNTKYQLSRSLATNAVFNTPQNITAFFTTPGIPDNDGNIDESDSLLGNSSDGDPLNNDYALPKYALASNQSSYIVVDYFYDNVSGWNDILGFGNNEQGQIQYWDDSLTMGYPEYLDYDYYYDDHFVRSFANNGTFSGTVNQDGDFLLQGINTNNRLGSSDTEENYVVNFSDEVRYFEEYIYGNLPTSFEAPLDDEYVTLTVDQIGSIFGYWVNDYWFQAGIVSYYFDENNDFLTDRERLIITEEQWENMREIFAEVFEDEIVYGWAATDALLLTELQNEEPEYRSSYRDYLEFYTEYGSDELSWYLDDSIYLDDATIALLDPSVETRLDEFRAIIENVADFEDNSLQTLLDAIAAFDLTSDEEFFYTDEDNNEWLDLYDLNVGALIEAGLGDDILAVISDYESLSEIEQMLLTEYYYWNYDELYYGYYEYFINAYESDLFDIYDIEENNYYQLFDMLSEIEALLGNIEDLNDISYEWFTTYDEEGDFYWYEGYSYWIYLSELLPQLQEAKPVYDEWQAIELGLEYDNFEEIVMDRDSALAILAMYENFSDLSENAQYTLDSERISYLYELALSFLVNEVEDSLYNIYVIEDESGLDGLFDNLDDVNAALALYEDLPESALEYMDSDARDYYEYLKGLQAALTEALPVYNMIKDLPSNSDDLTDEEIAAILSTMEAYNELSDDAKELIDTELLLSLLPAAARGAIDNLPSVEELKLDDESDVEQARRAYDLLTEEQKEELGDDYLTRLNAAEARIAELKQGQWISALITLGVLVIHLAAGAYFVFLKRKDLAKLTGIKALAK